MNFITDEILTGVIADQPTNEFGSHDIFSTLMARFPREYVSDLCEALNSDQDPFVKLHTDIAKHLTSAHFSDVVRPTGVKRRSRNCRGQYDMCEVWHRV